MLWEVGTFLGRKCVKVNIYTGIGIFRLLSRLTQTECWCVEQNIRTVKGVLITGNAKKMYVIPKCG